ncbi:MAG TPA: PAS domain S-box protein [Burkholderiales bacterium]|nr:PAS domain S-box protein [Burkholderiales bacterium]
MKEIVLPHFTEEGAPEAEDVAARRAVLVRTFTASAYVAALLACGLAIAALLADVSGYYLVLARWDGWPHVRLLDAACVLLSSVSVLMQQRRDPARRIWAPILFALTVLILLLVLLWPGIHGGMLEHAMARYPAVALLTLQVALIGGYLAGDWGRMIARVFGAAVAVLGFCGLLGVGFRLSLGMPPLMQLSFPGGIALILLGYSMLVGRSDRWLAEQLTSTRPSAILIRRLLPVVVVLPVLLAVVRVWAQHVGLIDTAIGVLIIMVCSVVILAGFVLWTANMIESADAARHRAQRSADAQREWLKVTLISINDAVVATDPEGVVRVINPAAEALIGVSGETFVGSSLAGIVVFSKDGGAAGDLSLQDLLQSEEADRRRILTLRRMDGHETPVEVSTAPIRDAAGRPLGSVMVLRDVSELQKTERALRTAYEELDKRVAERTNALQQANAALHDTLALFRGVTESTPDLVFVKDLQGRVLMANPATTKALNRKESDIVGKRATELVQEVHWAQREVEHDQRVVLSGQVERAEQVLPTPEGERTYLSTKSPLRNEEGQTVSVITVATDITERKRIENDLLEAQRFTQGLLDTAPLVLYLIDLSNGRIVFASGMVLSALGYTTDALLAMDAEALLDLVHPEDKPVLSAHRHTYETAPYELKNFELRFRHRNGDWRWLHCRERLFDAAATKRLALGVAIDVTDRRRVEREREQLISAEQRLRHEAERANRAKDEFLAIVSHELRSPLNALRGWSFLLGNSRSPDADLIERATQAIKRNVDHQARLIDDLLDTSRIMSGKLTLERRPLNLVEVLNSAIEVVRPAAVAKRITIDFRHPPNSLSIDGDPARLHQIVVNLLTNAVKFTPDEGRIDINADAVNGFARMVFTDTGVGIEPDFLPRVFERFSQADTSTTRKHGGLGIGLALVRHLAEMHGGRVWAESEGQAKGATFTVEIPLPVSGTAVAQAPAAPAPEFQDDSLAGLTICAVDDDPDARDIVNATLRRAGATVHSASSGTDLIAILDSLMPETRPDVMLMDLAMPGEDGFAVLGNVRALEKRKGLGDGKRVPVIAVTAFTDIERTRVLEKGFAEHVGKPFDPNALVNTILRVSGGIRS